MFTYSQQKLEIQDNYIPNVNKIFEENNKKFRYNFGRLIDNTDYIFVKINLYKKISKKYFAI